MTTPSENLLNSNFSELEQWYLTALFAALEPLVKIADAFDANNLDDEARKFWGKNNEHQCQTPHDKIELYTGRGGGTLLTLADCMRARDILRGIPSGNPCRDFIPPSVFARRGRIRLLTRHGEYGAGSVVEYEGFVNHGGHTDSQKQYILKDGTYVASQNATELS